MGVTLNVTREQAFVLLGLLAVYKDEPEIAALAASIMRDIRGSDAPTCVRAMGCLCAWHAVGAPASDECDANEERARDREACETSERGE